MILKHVIQDFDLQRAIIRNDIIFEPVIMTPQNTTLLQTALKNQQIGLHDPLIVFTVGETIICLNLVHMIYHHVAQGVADNVAWMVSFCVVCNAGMLFSPTVDGKTHHFADGGFYNAMTLLTDRETRSIWNHITGQCLYGVHKDAQLTHIGTPLQKTTMQVIAEYPQAVIAIGQLDDKILKDAQTDNAERLNPDLNLSERATNTLRLDDDRLPRFEMGLGIWTGQTQKFYPYRKIIQENALLDTLDGNPILIHSSPESIAPEAFYTTAKSFEWLNDVLKLDNGQSVRDGVLYDGDGQVVHVDRPQQLFQRWYLLFDTCEIYK